MQLVSQLETILFVAGKPVSLKKLAKALQSNDEEVAAALHVLAQKYNQPESGVTLLSTQDEWQLVSKAENKEVAEQFVKAELSGELTRPQLETLTVISYCGPITKPELEQIRGVNCGLILRNLMLRGLVKESETSSELLPTYEITMEYLRHLGIASVTELPDYATLHSHEYITRTLSETEQTHSV